MLGFAVIDISNSEHAITVWLTSTAGASAAHSNAVVFGFDDLDPDDNQLRAFIADRYVVLSDRTDPAHPVLVGAHVTASSIEDLAAAIVKSHGELKAAIAEHAAAAGRRGVTQPATLTTLIPLEQTTSSTTTAPMVTLALANHLRLTWTAWLTLNADWQRRPYLAHHPDRPPINQLVPPDFATANSLNPAPVPR